MLWVIAIGISVNLCLGIFVFLYLKEYCEALEAEVEVLHEKVKDLVSSNKLDPGPIHPRRCKEGGYTLKRYRPGS